MKLVIPDKAEVWLGMYVAIFWRLQTGLGSLFQMARLHGSSTRNVDTETWAAAWVATKCGSEVASQSC